MSKAVKKVTRVVSKATGGLLGMDDGASKAAKQQAQIMRQQADQQRAAAVEQARASTLAQQTAADRARIEADTADDDPVDDARVQVATSSPETAAARRKRFQSPDVGGGSGASIRI